MIKRIKLVTGIALAAVACAAPAAQAEVYLSDENGVLKVGAKVRTTSPSTVITRADGTYIECAVTKLHFELVDAGTEHLELEQIEDATTFNCEFNREAIKQPNLPVTIDDGTVGVGEGSILTIDTWGTGVTNVSFSSTIFADSNHLMLLAACTFKGNIHVEATFETSDTLTVTPSVLKGGLCGEGTLESEITLEAPDNGHAIQIHYEETE